MEATESKGSMCTHGPDRMVLQSGFWLCMAYGGVKCMLQLSNRMLFYPYCVKKHLFYGVFRA